MVIVVVVPIQRVALRLAQLSYVIAMQVVSFEGLFQEDSDLITKDEWVNVTSQKYFIAVMVTEKLFLCVIEELSLLSTYDRNTANLKIGGNY